MKEWVFNLVNAGRVLVPGFTKADAMAKLPTLYPGDIYIPHRGGLGVGTDLGHMGVPLPNDHRDAPARLANVLGMPVQVRGQTYEVGLPNNFPAPRETLDERNARFDVEDRAARQQMIDQGVITPPLAVTPIDSDISDDESFGDRLVGGVNDDPRTVVGNPGGGGGDPPPTTDDEIGAFFQSGADGAITAADIVARFNRPDDPMTMDDLRAFVGSGAIPVDIARQALVSLGYDNNLHDTLLFGTVQTGDQGDDGSGITGGLGSGSGSGSGIGSGFGNDALNQELPELTANEQLQQFITREFGNIFNPAIQRGIQRRTQFVPGIMPLLNPAGSSKTLSEFISSIFQPAQTGDTNFLPGDSGSIMSPFNVPRIRQNLQTFLNTEPRHGSIAALEDFLRPGESEQSSGLLSSRYGPAVTAALTPRALEVAPFFRDAILRQGTAFANQRMAQNPGDFTDPRDVIRLILESGF